MSTREWVVLYIMHKDGVMPITGGPALGAGDGKWLQPCHVGGVLFGVGVGPRAGPGCRRPLRRGGCAARRGGPLSFKKEGKEDQGERVSFPLDAQSLGIMTLWVGGPNGIDWPAALTL